MSVRWTDEQLAAIERDGELAVSAAAGSGKTAVLIERVVRAVVGGSADLEQVLVVTFTRAAAAELRHRLSEALRSAMREAAPEQAPRLRRQLAALSQARISTIHSFCLDVIQRFGWCAGIGAGRVLDPDESSMLRHELAGELLRAELDSADADLRAAALAWGGSDGIGPDDLRGLAGSRGLRDVVLRLHDFQRSLPDPARWFAQHVDWPPLDPQQPDPAHPALAQLESELRAWKQRARQRDEHIVTRLREGGHHDALFGELANRRAELLKHLSLERGWDGVAPLLARFKDKQNDIKWNPQLASSYRRDIDKEDPLYDWVEAAGKPLAAEVADWTECFSASWADTARRENAVRGWLVALWRLTERFEARFAAYKRERGVLDYADLERHALELLSADGGAAAGELASELRLVLVDEYQDTNPLQNALLAQISRDQRFLVGDLKQSIYAFRLAEPALFAGHIAALRQRQTAGEHGAGTLRLTANFRSRAGVLDAVNALFDGLMDARLGGEHYADSALRHKFDYKAVLGEQWHPDPPAVLHLVEENGGAGVSPANSNDNSVGADLASARITGGDKLPPYGTTQAEEDSDDGPEAGTSELVYRHVAARLVQLHDEGLPVYCKQQRGARRVAWRDMAVLLRKSFGRIELLRTELERAGVPFHAPGRSGFYERAEVLDALSLLAVVDNPRQGLALAAALRGPAAGLTPAELLEVRTASDTETDFWDDVRGYAEHGADPSLRDRLAAFVARLSHWRELARSEPLERLLHRLYNESGLLTACAAQRGGEQRVANLLALHDRARAFSQFERQGLARFLRYIELSRRAAGDAGEASLLDENQDVVRVLTVHQAKGQEFPIVIVPDLQVRFNLQDLSRDVQHSYSGGIGGRYFTLRPPERCDTLGLRAVKAERRAALLSEELRILYVALTRARERLELVAAVEPGEADDWSEHAGLRARRWLDWVGPQIAAADAPNPAWEVQRHSAVAQAHAQPTQQGDHAAQTALLLAALQHPYAYPATAQLPAKLAVTRLTEATAASSWQDHGAGDPAVTVGEAAQTDLVAEVHPAFLAPRLEPTPAELGTALHKLFAELDPTAPDYAAYADVSRLERLRDALIVRGRLTERPARMLELSAVVRLVADLAARLPRLLGADDLAGVKSWVELPFSMSISGAEAAGFLAAEAGELRNFDAGLDPAARVQVVGAIDLLLASDTTALVLDYKSGYPGLSAAQLADLHAPQLGWYCRGVAELLPGHRLLWAVYGLDGAGLSTPREAPPSVSATRPV